MDKSGPAHSMQGMPGMPGMDTRKPGAEKMSMQPESLVEARLQHATSGTDAEPNSTPIEMLMTTKGNWRLMFHGEGFLIETQQSGPRGYDKLFSTNWLMPMAQRKFGKGTLTLRTMLSFEPSTVSKRVYPELFQQGETAFGRPIVDGQHPHDFFMELAALYDYKLAEHTLLSVYAAPMGDPAMGPPAYHASQLQCGSLGLSRKRARRIPLEHQFRANRFVVGAVDCQSRTELEFAIFHRADAQPGVAGAR
jgi:hypothetical protein